MALPTGKVTVKTQDLTKFGIIDIISCYWVFAIYYHICYQVLIFVRSGFKNICNKQIIQNCLTKNSLDFGNVWKTHSYYICMFFPPPNNKLKILISWQFNEVLKENISQLILECLFWGQWINISVFVCEEWTQVLRNFNRTVELQSIMQYIECVFGKTRCH